jgi:acyl transferase domain-containing protein/acyl carrier protein
LSVPDTRPVGGDAVLRRALTAIRDLQAKLQSSREPIAIVGMACRFPGAEDPDAFWHLLETGTDAIREIPPGRWPLAGFYDPDPDAVGRSISKWGGFVPDIDRFDAAFFGITPREAAAMDPQQRLLLEVAWQALEDAGQRPEPLAGSRTGVFVGLATEDFSQVQLRSGDPRSIDAYAFTGTAYSVAGGRLSYLLGLQGPNLSVDTACSSSLVAIHLACQSLRARECDLAFAGGVNALLTPELFVYFSKLRAMAPDGRCKTFDAGANGYVRGEGAGMLLLKRLSDAEANGDRILALVAGSAVNHDGHSSGLTAPNGRAQEAVIRGALVSAGLAPHEIDYVQAHGTGTPLGDPIEARALGEVLRQGRPANAPLYIGSVKTNVGHLEAAAGVAGAMAAIQAIRHRTIPPHLHLRSLNPALGFDAVPARVAATPTPWAEQGHPRAAGISSFGFSGTNAHIVIREAPPGPEPALPSRPHAVLRLSARTPDALCLMAAHFADFIDAHPSLHRTDLCGSANTGRGEFTYRLGMHGEDVATLASLLRRHADGQPAPAVHAGQVARGKAARPVFLFSGQGLQYPGMALPLLEQEPVFRTAFEACDAIAAPRLGRSLRDICAEAPADTGLAQPALFAIGYACAALWQSWGVKPAAVAGHSLGEYIAACVAGMLSLEAALHLVMSRAEAMQALPPVGAMAAISLPAKELAPRLDNDLCVAAVNAAAETVVSGAEAALARLLDRLARDGIKAHRLPVSHAFHSPLMQPAAETLDKAAATVVTKPPTVPFWCNATGKRMTDGAALEVGHWSRHLLATVQWHETLRNMTAAGHTLFLEIGPRAALSAAGAADLAGSGFIPSLRNRRPPGATLAEALARLYAAGVDIDWDAVERDRFRRISLPTYPFERQRHWPLPVARPLPGGLEPLLRRAASPLLPDRLYSGRWSAAQPALRDHRIHGVPVLAASAFVAMLLRAAADEGWKAAEITDLEFIRPLHLPESAVLDVQLVLAAQGDGRFAATLVSLPTGSDCIRHASAQLVRASSPELAERAPRPLTTADQPMSGAAFYARLDAAGYHLGPGYRAVTDLRIGRTTTRATLAVPDKSEDAQVFPLAPGVLDGCFQTLVAPLLDDLADGALVPIALSRLRWRNLPSPRLQSIASLSAGPVATDVIGDARLFDSEERLIVDIEGLRLRRSDPAALARQVTVSPASYAVKWRDMPLPTPGPQSRQWLLLGDSSGLAPSLANAIHGHGSTALVRRDQRDAHDLDWQGRGIAVLLPPETLRNPEHAARRDLMQRLIGLIRAAANSDNPLAIVTSGVPQGGAHPSQPLAGLLPGLLRVAAREHPNLQPRLIDLDPARPFVDQAAQLAHELLHGREPWVALHGTRRVPQLVPHWLRTDPLQPTAGWILITGGRGMLGRSVAQRLAELGFRHIALAGRTPPDLSNVDDAALGARGTTVRHLIGDVAEPAVAEQWVQALARTPEGLSGVIHAAGVRRDSALATLDEASLDAAMRAKVEGAWALHQGTRGIPLRHFILFSSMAGLAGTAGQAAYAAASSFLDGLAAVRRAEGLPALAIDWGPWAEIGMAAAMPEADRERLAAIGLLPIAPDPALTALEHAMQTGNAAPAQLAIGRFDPALLASPRHASPAAAPRLDLAALPPTRRSGALIERIALLARQIMGLPIDAAIPDDQSLFELGMDSLMAVDLSTRIAQSIGRALPATLLFDHPSLAALADHLLPDDRPDRPDLDSMNEAALADLLESKLQGVEP